MSGRLDQLDLQELQKAWVGVSIGGQIVEQKRRINRRQIGFHQFLLNGLNENQAQDQTDQGQSGDQKTPQIQAFIWPCMERPAGLKGCAVIQKPDRLWTGCQGTLTGNPEAFADVMTDVL